MANWFSPLTKCFVLWNRKKERTIEEMLTVIGNYGCDGSDKKIIIIVPLYFNLHNY